MKTLESLVRPNIWALEPYSCARDEFKGMDAHVFLDANENPYNDPINRYPDPLQEKLKERLAPLKGVRPSARETEGAPCTLEGSPSFTDILGQRKRRSHRPHLSHLLQSK